MNEHRLLPIPVDDGAKRYRVDECAALSYTEAIQLIYSRYTRVNAKGEREVPPHAVRRLLMLNEAHARRPEVQDLAKRELRLRLLERQTLRDRPWWLRSWLRVLSGFRFLRHVLRSAKA